MVQVNTVPSEQVILNDISGTCGPFENISQGKGFIFLSPLENINTAEVSNKRKRAKRGKPNTNMWKQNLRKRNRQLGKEYVSVAGKSVRARTCLYKNCNLCPRKCNQHFSREECELLFKSFWDIGDLHNQRQYISSLIKIVETERTRCKTLSRRQSTMKYYLVKNNIEVKVCREFFRKTFNVPICNIFTYSY